jgi:photosystem II stability/assembly factor-like uncharacterized protein
MYAATENGLFSTTDGGATWKLLNPDLTSADVSILAVGAEGAGNLYAAKTHSAGILKSSDGGMSWSMVNSGLRAVSIGSLVVDSTATLYASSDTSLWKSTDVGASWNVVLNDDTAYQLSVLAADPRAPGTVYAAGAAGVLRSADGGISWNVVRPVQLSVGGFAIDPQSSDILYATVGTIGSEGCWYEGACGGLMLKSTDRGKNWEESDVSGYYIGALAVDPINPGTMYAGAFGEDRRPAPPPHTSVSPAVLKSTDGGANWTVVYSGETWGGGWALSVAIDPQNPRTLYAYTPGILKSTDGGTSWFATDTGLNTTVRAMLIDPQTPATLYAGTNAGVFRSTDAGASWTAINAGLTSRAVISLALDPHDPVTLYAGTLGGGVFGLTFTKREQ